MVGYGIPAPAYPSPDAGSVSSARPGISLGRLLAWDGGQGLGIEVAVPVSAAKSSVGRAHVACAEQRLGVDNGEQPDVASIKNGGLPLDLSLNVAPPAGLARRSRRLAPDANADAVRASEKLPVRSYASALG